MQCSLWLLPCYIKSIVISRQAIKSDQFLQIDVVLQISRGNNTEVVEQILLFLFTFIVISLLTLVKILLVRLCTIFKWMNNNLMHFSYLVIRMCTWAKSSFLPLQQFCVYKTKKTTTCMAQFWLVHGPRSDLNLPPFRKKNAYPIDYNITDNHYWHSQLVIFRNHK